MKSNILTETEDGKVWFLVLDKGEEVKKTLEDFATAEKIAAASFVALGAFERAKIGYSDEKLRRLYFDTVLNYPTLSEAYKVAALDVTNKLRELRAFDADQ